MTVLPSWVVESLNQAPRLAVFCKSAPTLIAISSMGRTRQGPVRGDRALRSVGIWHVKVWRRPTLRQRQIEHIMQGYRSVGQSSLRGKSLVCQTFELERRLLEVNFVVVKLHCTLVAGHDWLQSQELWHMAMRLRSQCVFRAEMRSELVGNDRP